MPNNVNVFSLMKATLLQQDSGLFAREPPETDGHPIIENYVLVSHAAVHLENDVTPHAPEHNCDYRTPRLSCVINA